jgi:CrcB protein
MGMMKFTLNEQVLVGIGGCIGSVARYQINEWIPSLSGTFIVNILGCIAIGMLMYESIYFGAFSRNTRLFLGVGLIGSFTTFSAFATQSIDAGLIPGGLNIVANIIFGLFGVFIGRFIILKQGGLSWNT